MMHCHYQQRQQTLTNNPHRNSVIYNADFINHQTEFPHVFRSRRRMHKEPMISRPVSLDFREDLLFLDNIATTHYPVQPSRHDFYNFDKQRLQQQRNLMPFDYPCHGTNHCPAPPIGGDKFFKQEVIDFDKCVLSNRLRKPRRRESRHERHRRSFSSSSGPSRRKKRQRLGERSRRRVHEQSPFSPPFRSNSSDESFYEGFVSDTEGTREGPHVLECKRMDDLKRRRPLTNGRLKHFPSLSTIYNPDENASFEEKCQKSNHQDAPKWTAAVANNPDLMKMSTCVANNHQLQPTYDNNACGSSLSSGRSSGETIENHRPTDPLDDLPPVIQPLRLDWRQMRFGASNVGNLGSMYGAMKPSHPKTNPRVPSSGGLFKGHGSTDHQEFRMNPYPLDPMFTATSRGLFDTQMFNQHFQSGSKTLPLKSVSMTCPEQFNLPSILAKSIGIRGILFLTVYVLDWTLIVQVCNAAFFFPPLPAWSCVKVELKPSNRTKRGSRIYPAGQKLGFAKWSHVAGGDRPDFSQEFRFNIGRPHLKRGDKLGISVYASNGFEFGESSRELLGQMSFSLRKFFRTAHPEAFPSFVYRDMIFEDGNAVKVCDSGYFLLPEKTGSVSHLAQNNVLHRKYYDEIGSFSATNISKTTTNAHRHRVGGFSSTNNDSSAAGAILAGTTTTSGSSPSPGPFIVPLSPIRAQQLRNAEQRRNGGCEASWTAARAAPNGFCKNVAYGGGRIHPGMTNEVANEGLASLSMASLLPPNVRVPSSGSYGRASPFSSNEPIMLGVCLPSPRHRKCQSNSDGLSNQSSLTSHSGGSRSSDSTGMLGAEMSEAFSGIASHLHKDFYTSESSTSNSSNSNAQYEATRRFHRIIPSRTTMTTESQGTGTSILSSDFLSYHYADDDDSCSETSSICASVGTGISNLETEKMSACAKPTASSVPEGLNILSCHAASVDDMALRKKSSKSKPEKKPKKSKKTQSLKDSVVLTKDASVPIDDQKSTEGDQGVNAGSTETTSPSTSKRKLFGRTVKRTLMGPLMRHKHREVGITSASTSLLPSLSEIIRWQQSFSDLLRSKCGRALFRQFLAGEHSDENLDFWVACEEFRTLLRPGPGGQDASRDCVRSKAFEIYSRYIANGAEREVNLEGSIKSTTFANLKRHLGLYQAEDESEANASSNDPLLKEIAADNVFSLAQAKIEQLMASDSYQRFLKSDLYNNLRLKTNNSSKLSALQHSVVSEKIPEDAQTVTPSPLNQLTAA